MKKVVLLLLLLSSIHANEWYEFKPSEKLGISEFNMTDWLEKLAGIHGFVQNVGNDLMFEDGTKVKFYRRFEKAIRETGFKGTIIGSCFQAGSGPTHFYNLHTDVIMGLIDRHNYHGGGTGHTFHPGKCKNRSMVSEPGSGLLVSGFQQVKNAPFSFSEWMSLIQNEWIAEGSPIVAAYGMGVQGWDASYSFASDFPHFTETIHTPGIYNVMSPTQLALYPAMASMIYRNDVKEGEIVSIRIIHIPSLIDGKMGFWEDLLQDRDQKSFHGITPNKALACGRIAVDFVDEFTKTEKPDFVKYWERESKFITSNTRQLYWNYSKDGYFTINTPGTKGCIGFSEGKTFNLDEVEISIETPFAVVLVSSMDKKPIKKSKNLLVTTVARAKNTGMEYNEDKTQISF